MNDEMYGIIKNGLGFIAALDQSGGSTSKTLKAYGIAETEYSTEEEMFELIHEMRKRVFVNEAFNSKHILGAILFEKTMMSKVEDEFTADYLWNKKHIVSFLKIDKGLEEENNGVKLMKNIPDIKEMLKVANEKHIFGTKMRSVIYKANEQGIKEIVEQQFKIANIICEAGLVPIIEPEVDICAKDKAACEQILKREILSKLKSWPKDKKIMFKFTLPTEPNLYLDLYEFEAVVRIVALSGGYDVDTAAEKLAANNNMIASFSRALLQNLSIEQTEQEFTECLNDVITKIYNASIT